MLHVVLNIYFSNDLMLAAACSGHKKLFGFGLFTFSLYSETCSIEILYLQHRPLSSPLPYIHRDTYLSSIGTFLLHNRTTFRDILHYTLISLHSPWRCLLQYTLKFRNNIRTREKTICGLRVRHLRIVS